MAEVTVSHILSTWQELFANPVFRRVSMPRGLRFFTRSPFLRAIALSAVAIALLELVERTAMTQYVFFGGAIAFWFLLMAVQRYFCWFELHSLRTSGTLDDYINSGLSRADIAIGIVHPAAMAERLAVMGAIGWFWYTSTWPWSIKWIYPFGLLMNAMWFFAQPALFLPTAEAYLRKRNPLALYFIGFQVIVPVLTWFGIFFGSLYAIATLAGLFNAGIGANTLFLLAFGAAWFLDGWLMRHWNTWLLKRFYSRYENFDDLFDRYVE